MSEPSGVQYGGFWIRFLALLADSAIVFLFFALAVAGAAMALEPALLVPAALTAAGLGVLYWPVLQASRQQATLGKSIVGLKVTRFDGRRISILRAVWRELTKAVSAGPALLGYAMAAVMPRKQGLHDILSATYVVREGPARIVPAVAVAAVGFALPLFAGPMVVDAAAMARITDLAKGFVVTVDQYVDVPVEVTKVIQDLQASIQAQAPAAAKAPPPARTKAAATPAKVAKPAPEPKAEPAEAKLVALPLSEPTTVERPKAVEKPKAPTATQTSKPAAQKVAAAKAPRPATPRTAQKIVAGGGLRHNDLMSAVLDRDLHSVNALLKLGKWADKPDSSGTTPLMAAADMGDVKMAESLLRAGADARPAMQIARKRGDSAMMVLLKRHTR